MNGIYQEKLMDYYKNPKNKKKIKNPDFSTGRQNPSCGDNIIIEGKIQDGKIKELGFDGSGCVISMAAASMLLEHCIGKTINEVLTLSKEDILEMLGVQLGPNRMKCALLSLEALRFSLEKLKE